MMTIVERSNLNYVVDLILKKRKDFQIEYGKDPKYLKIPESLYHYYIEAGVDETFFACGLTICPTISIERLENIEVF